jgi:hypothetical protein
MYMELQPLLRDCIARFYKSYFLILSITCYTIFLANASLYVSEYPSGFRAMPETAKNSCELFNSIDPKITGLHSGCKPSRILGM